MVGVSVPVVVNVIKIGHRRFIAATEFTGELILSEDPRTETVTAFQGKSALKLLEAKLRDMKVVVPVWNVEKMSVPQEGQPEESDEDSSPVEEVIKEPEEVQDEEEPVTLERPEVQDGGVLIPEALPDTDHGWITPSTDLDAWKAGYLAAVLGSTGFEVKMLRNLVKDQGKDFRLGVTAIMKSQGMVGPWERNAADCPWHIVTRIYDPTSFEARPGEGDRRVMKDLNGLKRKVVTGELVQERRYEDRTARVQVAPVVHPVVQTAAPVQLSSARNEASLPIEAVKAVTVAHKVPMTAVAGSGHSEYKYLGGREDQRAMAFSHAKEYAERAILEGHDERTQEIWAMIGYVRVLRAMKLPPHIEFENALREAGVPEDALVNKKAA